MLFVSITRSCLFLGKMASIDTMLTTFLMPLPEYCDKNDRIHCSLNLNTETGRLSARRPNLQNQPGILIAVVFDSLYSLR